jgi:lysophospholipase L1-like esterase
MATEMSSFLALGDSYTIGEGVDSTARWPVVLAGTLRAAGMPIRDPVVVARTGWTTQELSAGIDQAGMLGSYDLVSLLIGVNNQYRGLDLEEYRAQFAGISWPGPWASPGGTREGSWSFPSPIGG